MHYRIQNNWSIDSPEGQALAERGKLEIELAEREMPGVMTLRQQYANSMPLQGARIAGCLHVTAETAVLIRTLKALGAEVRWSPCNVLSTQDEAAAALAAEGVPIFAWKGMSEGDYIWCISQALQFEGMPVNLLIDDGGDLTAFVHQQRPELLQHIQGVAEQTTTGVRLLEKSLKESKLKIPAYNVNDSITKSKFDNTFGCRESLIDGIKSAIDVMIGGKTVVIAGYGDVGKGCAEGLKGLGAHVVITEQDPIAAYMAVMQGFPVVTMEEAIAYGDIFITATGCIDVIRKEHLENMKKGAIVCNIGHFNVEIDMNWLDHQPNIEKQSLKPGLDRYHWHSKDHEIYILAEGRLVNLSAGRGHPSFVMSNSFCNQIFALLDLWQQKKPVGIYRLPRNQEEEIARLHLTALGAHLTQLTPQQKEYLDLK